VLISVRDLWVYSTLSIMLWLYALISVVIISLLSFVGIVTFAVKQKHIEKVLLVLVAFSVGALLGDSFFHLLPEAVEKTGSFTIEIALLVLLGIIIFFSLEKFLRWRHCHQEQCEDHIKELGTMNLVGDAAHNLIDGILIGASFLISLPLGIATTIAVAAHEIPHELGNYGILLHSGYSRKQALLYNFYSALTAVAGTLAVLIIGSHAGNIIYYLIPITAGNFIYIAMSDLIPELHHEEKASSSAIHFLAILSGIAIMLLLLYLG